ncbi:family 20 glycosylhydrolase [Nocardia uniformis]|uniref:Family 20 glycosylhydrolase n=1 Tax=Nocardia uniformis TaxID=53432 RepID=A0A849CAT8_9NOCA|nr:glycoside hydrolase family 20 protein [Nocardia uniformis]NNH74828.1 family 20 glycosylhydrolase [Nocardia uniformis]
MTYAPRAVGVVLAVGLFLAALFALPFRSAPTARAESTPVLPISVPSVREWQPGTGRFELPDTVRVVAGAGAGAVAGRFAEDLHRAGHATTVTSGVARPGDVVLRVDDSGPAQAEAYRIDIAATVTVSARTRAGVMHGAQTLLQWFSQRRALPGGTVSDRPDYVERGLSLDLGRQFLSVDWIKQRIREMAYYRMNVLHMHLSDRYGFRLESKSHPEITSPEHYSPANISEIISYAAEYGIDVVPEIGFPSHMNAILEPHPELILHPAFTSPVDSVTDSLLAGTAEGRIDLSNPRARPLIEDLLREFVPQFPSHYFHIGGDEYASDYSRYPQLDAAARTTLGPRFGAPDLIADFFNWAGAIVRSYGKTPRMWNDGIPHGGSISIDTSIIVDHWTAGNGLLPWVGNDNGPEQLADQGRTLSNAAFTPTYWATGGYAAPLNAPPELLYAWDPGLFVNGTRLRPDQRSQLLGSKLYVWCDDPTAMTEQQMVGPIQARLPIMAQQLWSGTGGVGYDEFTDRVRAVGSPAP